MKTFVKIVVIALSATLFFAGCSGDDNQTVDNETVLVSVEELGSFDSFDEFEEAMLDEEIADTRTMSGTLGGYDKMENALKAGMGEVQSLRNIWKLMKDLFIEIIDPTVVIWSYKITWKSDPSAPDQTGRLFVPYKAWGKKSPVLVFTHPTETLRKFSPSKLLPLLDGTYTKIFGALFASTGFVVVIPDYPGMGDNYQPHPYCLKSLGKSAATMVDAVRKSFRTNENRTYVMGFSEGGYAALATAFYMVNHPQSQYNLQGVAALSGPYDLSGTMKHLMLTANSKYLAPYFLPYTINGYFDAYPEVEYLEFSRSIVKNTISGDEPPFYKTLQPMLDGGYSGTQISEFMYTVKPDNPDNDSKKNTYYGPISITTTEFQKELNDKNSELNTKLKDNTLVRSDWYPGPNIKYYFSHYKDDDCVLVGNTEAMKEIWGKYDNVTFSIYDTTFPLTKDSVGSWHAASIAQAYFRGLKFVLGYSETE